MVEVSEEKFNQLIAEQHQRIDEFYLLQQEMKDRIDEFYLLQHEALNTISQVSQIQRSVETDRKAVGQIIRDMSASIQSITHDTKIELAQFKRRRIYYYLLIMGLSLFVASMLGSMYFAQQAYDARVKYLSTEKQLSKLRIVEHGGKKWLELNGRETKEVGNRKFVNVD